MSHRRDKRERAQSQGNNNQKGGSGNSQQTPGLARSGDGQQKVSDNSGNSSESSKGTRGNDRQGGSGGAIRSGR
ncbi:MAG: hypothetical protein EOO16_08370 [Chitinophagaceae bacterium]|nr:MAG: hypothetical protein EOO16_08370 [Chitinophagaceae bacterium]